MDKPLILNFKTVIQTPVRCLSRRVAVVSSTHFFTSNGNFVRRFQSTFVAFIPRFCSCVFSSLCFTCSISFNIFSLTDVAFNICSRSASLAEYHHFALQAFSSSKNRYMRIAFTHIDPRETARKQHTEDLAISLAKFLCTERVDQRIHSGVQKAQPVGHNGKVLGQFMSC